MGFLVMLLFFVLWIVVAYFGLRFAATRYFHEPGRAEVAAIAVALAFALGAILPFATRVGGSAVQAPAVQAPGPPADTAVVVAGPPPAPQPGGRDTSSACRSLKASRGSTRYGSIDDVRPHPRYGKNIAIVDGGLMDSKLAYFVEGWAADLKGERSATAVCLIVDGSVERGVSVFTALARPDVANGYHHDALTLSGYRVEIPAGALSLGRHRLQVLSVSAGGRIDIVATAQRTVTVY